MLLNAVLELSDIGLIAFSLVRKKAIIEPISTVIININKTLFFELVFPIVLIPLHGYAKLGLVFITANSSEEAMK